MNKQTWIPAIQRPPSDGNSRLVMLDADNCLDYTSTDPVMAEFAFFVRSPNDWTIYLDGEYHVVTDSVLWWMDLPKPPQ